MPFLNACCEGSVIQFSHSDKLSREGKGEVALFSAKHWDRGERADLIDSATLCHDSGGALTPREGGGSSIVKVPGDVPPARVYFFGLVV